MTKLADKECIPCKDDKAPLKGRELTTLAKKLGKEWRIVKKHHLERDYKFKNFREALAFTNKVGKLAEEIQHHPDIYLAWGKVKLTLWSHSVGGLAVSDFIFAAKVNKLS